MFAYVDHCAALGSSCNATMVQNDKINKLYLKKSEKTVQSVNNTRESGNILCNLRNKYHFELVFRGKKCGGGGTCTSLGRHDRRLNVPLTLRSNIQLLGFNPGALLKNALLYIRANFITILLHQPPPPHPLPPVEPKPPKINTKIISIIITVAAHIVSTSFNFSSLTKSSRDKSEKKKKN